MNDYSRTIAPAERPRDYAGLLWIFAAGILGFGMFCATSAVALSDSSLDEPIAVAPGDLVNQAFSDINTAAALTAQAFAQLINTETATPTASLTPTATVTLTPTPTPTRTRIIVSPTSSRPPADPVIVPQRPTNTPIPIDPFTPTSPPVATTTPNETPTETPDLNPPTPEPSLPPSTSGTP